MLYVRQGALTDNSEIKLIDAGNLWYMATGIDVADTALGDLFLEYTVDLYIPQVAPTAGVATTLIDLYAEPIFKPLGGDETTAYQGLGDTGIDRLGPDLMSLDRPGRYLMNFEFTGTGFNTGNTLLGLFEGDVMPNDSVAVLSEYKGSTAFNTTLMVEVDEGHDAGNPGIVRFIVATFSYLTFGTVVVLGVCANTPFPKKLFPHLPGGSKGPTAVMRSIMDRHKSADETAQAALPTIPPSRRR
jgi:hypothetical protein